MPSIVKSVIGHIVLFLLVFLGCFSAIRISTRMDERNMVEQSAKRSYFRYRISTLHEAELEREMRMMDAGMFRMWDGTFVAEPDEGERKRLEIMVDACRDNRVFFNEGDADVSSKRREQFIHGCWKYYLRNGIVFNERRYEDVRWRKALDKFAREGVVDGDYVRNQIWNHREDGK